MTVRRAVENFLAALDLDGHPETEGTPQRVDEFWRQNLVSGYGKDPDSALGERIPSPSGAAVVVTNVPFHSVCPHHLVPYFGHVHLAYVPGPWIVGLGGLEELVATLSRRLMLQEQLCTVLSDTLRTALEARGAACAIEAYHLCLSLRGREPRSTRVYTHYGTGLLENEKSLLPGPTGSTTPDLSPCLRGDSHGHQ